MHVVAARFELRFPSPHSLKEKRARLKPIIEGLRNRFNLAAAEVDYQNQWQRASVGVAVVASTPSHAEDVLDEAERFVWSFPEVEILDVERAWMDSLKPQ